MSVRLLICSVALFGCVIDCLVEYSVVHCLLARSFGCLLWLCIGLFIACLICCLIDGVIGCFIVCLIE